MKLSKKGFQITEVPMLVIVLGLVTIVMAVMATILTQIQTTQTEGSYAYNVTQKGLEAQRDLSGWQSTWVVIIAAAVVLGIVSAYLFVRFTQ